MCDDFVSTLRTGCCPACQRSPVSTIELAYTPPPPRIAADLDNAETGQGVFAAAEALAAELPATAVPEPNCDGQVEHLRRATAVHRFVEAPGDSETVRWHFVEAGDPRQPTVVFLHGVPDSWWQWHYALDGLADRYHCLAIDLKGYGQSDKRTGDYRQAGVAAQLGALLDTVGVHRYIVITHDRGTPVADHLVAMHGARVRGYGRGQQHLWHLHPSLHPQQQLFTSPDAPHLLGDARRFVITAYSWLAERPVAHDDLLRTIEEFSHPGIASAVPRYFHSSSFRQEWVDRRTRLVDAWQPPVLLLQGAEDPVQPREFYQDPAVIERLPHGSDVHLLDSGHFWPFEAAEESVSVIGDFCDRVSSR
ncbi:alpha/beta hydrolase [Mycolicibacterium moriokaense]|nr:alpha/beta hydrolase [Mycolicibacterium moriokaense]